MPGLGKREANLIKFYTQYLLTSNLRIAPIAADSQRASVGSAWLLLACIRKFFSILGYVDFLSWHMTMLENSRKRRVCAQIWHQRLSGLLIKCEKPASNLSRILIVATYLQFDFDFAIIFTAPAMFNTGFVPEPTDDNWAGQQFAIFIDMHF